MSRPIDLYIQPKFIGFGKFSRFPRFPARNTQIGFQENGPALPSAQVSRLFVVSGGFRWLLNLSNLEKLKCPITDVACSECRRARIRAPTSRFGTAAVRPDADTDSIGNSLAHRSALDPNVSALVEYFGNEV